MPNSIDYKTKYKELKLKYKESVDLAFRLGVEEGMRQGQVQQAQQAQAQAEQAQALQANASGQPGQPGEEGAAPGQPPQTDGSELDQHIGQLEGMLGQSKQGSPEQQTLQKSIQGIKSVQSSLKTAYDLKKSQDAIKTIGKNLKTPFTLSKTATKNLTVPQTKALNDQEQLIQDFMKTFDEESKKTGEAITKTLSVEQLLKV